MLQQHKPRHPTLNQTIHSVGQIHQQKTRIVNQLILETQEAAIQARQHDHRHQQVPKLATRPCRAVPRRAAIRVLIGALIA
jgi:hypothetical protein